MRGLKWFAAGALAVPLCHQMVLLMLNAAGFIDRAPFGMEPTRPFGVPTLISLSFWGGVWGVLLMLLIGRMHGAGFWVAAMLAGAIAPTLVAAFIVAPLKGQPAGRSAKMAVVGLLVNAAWGLGTAILARMMEAWRATSRDSSA